MPASGDRYILLINGTTYDQEIERPSVTFSPDGLLRTATFRVPTLEQFYEAGNDVSVGSEVEIRIVGGEEAGQDAEPIFRGILVDKIVPEEDGAIIIELNCLDHGYNMTRTAFRMSKVSPLITKELYLFFKDDGSGAGAPAQYTRKAEFREKIGADYFIPLEDFDNTPLSSVRRYKTNERSVFLPGNQYQVQYNKKELVFNAPQVNTETPPAIGTQALPKDYVTGTPNPPNGVDGTDNGNWTYRAVVRVFEAPEYPFRNITEYTIENIWRTILTGDPLSDDGGAGYDSSMIELSYSYAKGANVVIPDRLFEGMRVTAYTLGSADITVSDGAAWAGKVSLDYQDVQGVWRTATITLIAGDVLTLGAVPVGMVVGLRVYGCDQLGRIVTLTGVGETVDEFVNNTDVTIAGTKYHIREVRDATTIVIVNTDETDDFSGLANNGTLIYHTIEYTGLTIKRLNWDKRMGTLADFYQYCEDNNMLPINYKIEHIPHLNIIRGRKDRQWRGLVTGATSLVGGDTVVPLDNVDGFYPLDFFTYRNATTDAWVTTTIVSVDYANEEVTIDGDHVAPIDVDDYVYPNTKTAFRSLGGEHTLTLEDMFYRVELHSTANQSFPVLNTSTTGTLEVAPTDPTGTGTWSITGGLDEMVDDLATTMYLLRWIATAAGALEGDPVQWGMGPMPHKIASWDTTEMAEYEKFILQLGYTEDNKPYVEQGGVHEYPMMTVMTSPDNTNWSPASSECIAKLYDPLNPNQDVGPFDCDLTRQFRYIGIFCDRPFFYKVGENTFGTPTRARDVPIVSFQLFRRPEIKYKEQDEESSQTAESPDNQIETHLDEIPFAQLTNKGGVISNIAGAGPFILTLPAGHNFEVGDRVEFWDTSAGVPHAGTDSSVSVDAVTATTIEVMTKPAALAVNDEVGASRRWMLDVTGAWRDFYAPIAIGQFFQFLKPVDAVEDESPQNGWDAQLIAVLRLYERMIALRDGTGDCLNDPYIRRGMQVAWSDLFKPELVAGISFNLYSQALATRQYNFTVEELARGDN